MKGNKCDLKDGGKRHDEISKRARRIAKIYGCVYESVSARDNPTDIIILLKNALNSWKDLKCTLNMFFWNHHPRISCSLDVEKQLKFAVLGRLRPRFLWSLSSSSAVFLGCLIHKIIFFRKFEPFFYFNWKDLKQMRE